MNHLNFKTKVTGKSPTSANTKKFEKVSPVSKVAKFPKTNTKRYVPVVTQSTQENEKLLQQLKPGVERTGTNIIQKQHFLRGEKLED